MNFPIYTVLVKLNICLTIILTIFSPITHLFRCLALLLIGPMCSAYSDQERQADRLRVAQIMQSSYDDDTKINRIQELLNIYRRMSPSLSPEDRDRLDNLIKPHTEEHLIFEKQKIQCRAL